MVIYRSGLQNQCPHCIYVGQNYNIVINLDHSPLQCPNKKRAIQILKEYDKSDLNDETDSNINISDLDEKEMSSLSLFVRRVIGRSGIKKAKSSTIRGEPGGRSFVITIDEVAELNILSEDLAKTLNIPIQTTDERAKAADGQGLHVIGQTQQCLVINGIFQGQKIEINLGVVLVVTNLQAELLLGEPGKRDNKMWTVPYQSLVMLKKSDKVHSTPYLEPDTNHQNYTAVRMAKTTVVEPGEFVELTVPP